MAPVPAASVAPVASAASANPGAAQRLKLVGVISATGESRAFIAVAGQPARSFRLGDAVDGDLVLREVNAQGAVLVAAQGGPPLNLALSQEPAASAPKAVAPPAKAAVAPLADGTKEAAETLRRQGARHAPINAPVAPAASEPQKPAMPGAAPVDDGRWRPAGS